MITDDERKKAAKNLRGMAPGSDWPKYVAEACGMDPSKMSNHFHTYTFQLCQRLADLIDPSLPKTCHMKFDTVHCDFVCSKCGAWVRTDASRTLRGASLKFCPNCGAKVVDSSND